ncbi:uncharacterized protein DUF3305 [Azospirillum brasilense]|uniref:Uncharacterized protein DUF3305 n=1 Tax=Azospirillum brasilense TaxID=192 RepID=A0A560ATQ6_AZOBR|nr:DUF3305 domain-containing protein [Azospirillum brasilense]TWA63767.1 uncharacterized protein DUF3305 [Azospirillum brasilense]
MTGQAERRGVGITVERQRIDNPWVDARWRVTGALPALPDRAPWTVLAEDGERTGYYAGAAEIVLHPGETENYVENLKGGHPMLYVILRRCAEEPGLRLLAVTVDPGEVDAHSDAGDDLIEAIPLPPDLAAWMSDFVVRHHTERPFYKRQRDRPDPEALARRAPVAHPGKDQRHG